MRIDDERLGSSRSRHRRRQRAQPGDRVLRLAGRRRGRRGILVALGDHRRRIQASINKQIRAKKTPILDFRPDQVITCRRAHRRHPARRPPSATRLARRRLMARRRPASVHGLVVVDKPAGVTSHDVVGMLRRRLGERRVGHAGTLDPGATGVLVIGVGKVTRLLRFVGRAAASATPARWCSAPRPIDARRRRRGRRRSRHERARRSTTRRARRRRRTCSATSSRCRRWCRR